MPFGDLSKRRFPHPVFQVRIVLSPWTDFWKHSTKMEKEMATHSSILAWEIPWTEETAVPGVI